MKRPLQGNATRYWPEFIPRRFTTTQPYTYRDTITTLRYMEEIRKCLDELHDQVNNIAEEGNNLENDINKYLEALIGSLDEHLERMRGELIGMINASNEHGTSWSPVRGRNDALDNVLSDMYDNLRRHALFAKDFDDMSMTAKEFDEKGFGARRFDLDTTKSPNAVLGDFKGRNDMTR